MDTIIVTSARKVVDFGTKNLLLLCEQDRGEPLLLAIGERALQDIEGIRADEKRAAEPK